MSLFHIQKLKRIRVFDLSDAIKPMEELHMKPIILQAFRRILTTESMCVIAELGRSDSWIIGEFSGLRI